MNTSFRDRQAWIENKGSIHKKDPYIDGQKNIGKIERSRKKEKEIGSDDGNQFVVGTAGSMMGTLDGTIGKDSLRKMEHEIMLTTM